MKVTRKMKLYKRYRKLGLVRKQAEQLALKTISGKSVYGMRKGFGL